ncbi:helix-turn-helix domain-containing protein [Vulcaniibacterium tengchongense]|uniref:Nlp family transcriptional regulator n=1 Tax=Vulcaniibacterium tengchongense TaxID=1273429 RepID=A0A3N4VFM1_9GAMM|nr:helix-turn-helix domain-containing protein [Vulcaniibacterium tengchongense]RPE81812.1 Nlp family transcriptional regulator [Vulcaniibacterium tengchongense]
MPTAAAPKKPAPQDWHPSDIKAALDKAGWSLRQLGFEHGYTGDSSLSEVFRRAWPKAEGIIASAIGLRPQEIWPSRYDANGNPNRRRGRAPKRPAHASCKATTRAGGRNPQKAAGA